MTHRSNPLHKDLFTADDGAVIDGLTPVTVPMTEPDPSGHGYRRTFRIAAFAGTMAPRWIRPPAEALRRILEG